MARLSQKSHAGSVAASVSAGGTVGVPAGSGTGDGCGVTNATGSGVPDASARWNSSATWRTHRLCSRLRRARSRNPSARPPSMPVWYSVQVAANSSRAALSLIADASSWASMRSPNVATLASPSAPDPTAVPDTLTDGMRTDILAAVDRGNAAWSAGQQSLDPADLGSGLTGQELSDDTRQLDQLRRP